MVGSNVHNRIMTNTKQKQKRQSSDSAASPIEKPQKVAKRLIGKPFNFTITGRAAMINANGTLSGIDIVEYSTKPHVKSFGVVALPTGAMFGKVVDGKVPGGMIKVPAKLATKLFD